MNIYVVTTVDIAGNSELLGAFTTLEGAQERQRLYDSNSQVESIGLNEQGTYGIHEANTPQRRS